MNVSLFFRWLFILCNTVMLGQFGSANLIHQDDQSIEVLLVVDFDADNDDDILYAEAEHEIGWYENLDGLGTFSAKQIISSNNDFNYIYDLKLADIDHDDDLDLLVYYTSTHPSISWFENDGNGSFLPPVLEIQKAVGFNWNLGDVDGDLDLDIVIQQGNSYLVWVEFDEVAGTYSDTYPIINNLDPWDYCFVNTVDFDSDGDVDFILTGDKAPIYYFENMDGLGNFDTGNILVNSFENRSSVKLVDFNGDNALDIVYESDDFYNSVLWYKNDGTNNFIQEPLSISGTSDVRGEYDIFDVDTDGDLDVVGAIKYQNKIVWWERLNLPPGEEFGPEQVVSTYHDRPEKLVKGDFNSDGKFDFVCASRNDHIIAWYENGGEILETFSATTPQYILYPSPTAGPVTISSEWIPTKMEVYNVQGQLILTVKNERQIDLSPLNNGLYLIVLTDPYGHTALHRILKD